MITTKVDLRGLQRFSAALTNDLRLKRNGPIRDGLHKWGEIYREFLRTRFVNFARGGGDWPALKPATIQHKGRNKRLILRDGFDSIFKALDPKFSGKPGQVQEDIPFGVRVGVGGNAMHPSGKISMQKLIQIHNEGRGNNPRRQIIVPPDGRAQQRMGLVMTAALKKTISNSAI